MKGLFRLLNIMLKAMIGKKMNMTAGYDTHGRSAPLTRVLVEPNFVVSIKTKEAQGYKAAEIGTGNKKNVTKALAGHFKKAGLETLPVRTAEVDYDGDLEVGAEIKLDEVFRKGALVDVVGTSKGKGFAGGMKRYGFHGGPKTHGQSDRARAPGSIGSGTTPGRVFKGTKMAGHMGAERVTVQGLQIIDFEPENNILVLKGSVPGPTGATLLIKKSIKKPKAYHEPEVPAIPHIGGGEEEKPAVEADQPAVAAEKPELEAIEVSSNNGNQD